MAFDIWLCSILKPLTEFNLIFKNRGIKEKLILTELRKGFNSEKLNEAAEKKKYLTLT